MTVKELISGIVNLASKINKRKESYAREILDEGGFMNNTYEYEFSRLFDNGLIKKKKIDDEIYVNPAPYGRIGGKKKTKKQLEKQYAKMKEFMSRDIYTPEGKQEFDEAHRSKYESFIRNRGVDEDEFSTTDWVDFIDVFKMIKEHAKAYGYEDSGAGEAYVNQYMKATPEQRAVFGDVVATAYENVKGEGDVTYKKILDELSILLLDSVD